MAESSQKNDPSNPGQVPEVLAGFRALVCQLGAREHYLVARCLARQGLLACLATDFWSPAGQAQSRILRLLPKVVLSALARYHPDLERERVASFPHLGIARYGLALFDKTGRHEMLIARRFARAVEKLRVPHDVFFGYSYDSLEILQEERRSGVFTMLCQTDPGPAHYRMVAEEEARWPEYVAAASRGFGQDRAERLRQEWELADVIIVNSEWTRDSILSAGAQASKIEILPLAFEEKAENLKPETLKEESRELKTENRNPEDGSQKSEVRPLISDLRSPVSSLRPPVSSLRPPVSDLRSPVSLPLRVLWLGNVALGKGIQYLVEAARLLAREPVEFIVGGSLQISAAVMQSGPDNIRWLGRIPRSHTSELYKDCDVFVFPTLSDGFGITQLEALSHGVPVITTPNCGKVVEDGKTGFIIPPRDANALANAILKFAGDRNLSASMAPACRDAVKMFSIEAYGKRLVEIIQKRHSKC